MAVLIYVEAARRKEMRERAVYSELMRPGKGVCTYVKLTTAKSAADAARAKFCMAACVLEKLLVTDGGVDPGTRVVIYSNDELFMDMATERPTERDAAVERVYEAARKLNVQVSFEQHSLMGVSVKANAYAYLGKHGTPWKRRDENQCKTTLK